MGPSLRQYLEADWQQLCAIAGWPAAGFSWRRALAFRMLPVTVLRIAGALQRRGWRRLAKLFSAINLLVFGLEAPAALEIGGGLVLPHPNGVILGAARIGSRVTIYQQVTLGAKTADFAYQLHLRPRIGDDVVIAAGAKVLGGIEVGASATVGANAVVLKDVPEGALAVGVPAVNRRAGEA